MLGWRSLGPTLTPCRPWVHHSWCTFLCTAGLGQRMRPCVTHILIALQAPTLPPSSWSVQGAGLWGEGAGRGSPGLAGCLPRFPLAAGAGPLRHRAPLCWAAGRHPGSPRCWQQRHVAGGKGGFGGLGRGKLDGRVFTPDQGFPCLWVYPDSALLVAPLPQQCGGSTDWRVWQLTICEPSAQTSPHPRSSFLTPCPA